MGLKLNNPNGEIILARKLNLVQKKFWIFLKIAFRNGSYTLFFQEDDEIAQKTRLFITFTSLIQMEWIKASHVDKNKIYKKKNLKI